mgnify:CR=1 FL=1
MVESNDALIEANVLSTTENSWQKLLEFQPDPNKKCYIRDITIDFNDASTFDAYIRVVINGVPILKEYNPINTQTKLSFGGDLVLTGKTDKPIIIYVKSDGINTLVATAIITGIQISPQRSV